MLLKRLLQTNLDLHSYITVYSRKKSLIVYARKGFSVHLERRGPETIEYSQYVYVERS